VFHIVANRLFLYVFSVSQFIPRIILLNNNSFKVVLPRKNSSPEKFSWANIKKTQNYHSIIDLLRTNHWSNGKSRLAVIFSSSLLIVVGGLGHLKRHCHIWAHASSFKHIVPVSFDPIIIYLKSESITPNFAVKFQIFSIAQLFDLMSAHKNTTTFAAVTFLIYILLYNTVWMQNFYIYRLMLLQSVNCMKYICK
jgi:hypothetical protein